jgi:hypothetical protein
MIDLMKKLEAKKPEILEAAQPMGEEETAIQGELF